MKKWFGLYLLVLGFLPFAASADFDLPITPCDTQQENFEIFGVNQHLSPTSEREDGTLAFTYGAGSDPFVSESGGVITFRFETTFTATSTVTNFIKLVGFGSDCQAIFGLGPTFFELASPAAHTMTYEFNGITVILDGTTRTSFPSGTARYLWIEVWDGVSGSTAASYSYLVDVQDLENPVENDPTPPPPPDPNTLPGAGQGTGSVLGTRTPAIISFAADKTTIREGETATISWDTADAEFVTLTSSPVSQPPLNIRGGEGELSSFVVSPSQTTTYTLAALSPGGEITRDLTITVAPRDPVIIVPGILGSWGGKLDPILRTYSGLWNGLKSVGYEGNKNLFAFPYDWRNDNRNTAELLSQKINQVLEICRCKKVDLVAHSMGGLVSRYYIQNINHDTVDQLIFLGTPHLGAPKAYLAWEAGELGNNSKERFYSKIFNLWSKLNGYNSVVKYIHDNVKSVGQLLPIFPYLMDFNSGDFFDYEKCPLGILSCNSFLEALNNPTELEIDYDNVKVYNLNEISLKTVSGYIIREDKKFFFEDINKWIHGIPINFPAEDGSMFGKGDGTVPENSSKFFFENNINISAKHDKLPYYAQSDVSRILIGKEISDFGLPPLDEILFVAIHSPADISITDANGSPVPDFFYSGSEDPEFITVPDPAGEYKINVVGTGEGHFEVEATLIGDDLEQTQSFSGEIKPGEVYQFSTFVSGNDLEELKVEQSPEAEEDGEARPAAPEAPADGGRVVAPTSTPSTSTIPVIARSQQTLSQSQEPPTSTSDFIPDEYGVVKGLTNINALDRPVNKYTSLLAAGGLVILSIGSYLILRRQKR